MSDEDSTLRAVALPAGAPIRVTQWLMAPVVLLVLGAIETYLSVTDASGSSRVFSIVAATIFFAAAVALSVYGYLAYRELTPAAVARHRWSKIVPLCRRRRPLVRDPLDRIHPDDVGGSAVGRRSPAAGQDLAPADPAPGVDVGRCRDGGDHARLRAPAPPGAGDRIPAPRRRHDRRAHHRAIRLRRRVPSAPGGLRRPLMRG